MKTKFGKKIKFVSIGLLLLCLISSSFAVSYSSDRKIMPGDVIQVLVYGYEDLSRVVNVSTEGTINFPYLQNLPVDGLTLDELRDIMIVQLSKTIEKKPVITLDYLPTYVINVSVLGQVQKPGSYQIAQNSTIQGAVGEAGGPLDGAKLREIQLIRRDVVNGDTVFTVNLEQVMVTGKLDELPELQDGDTIFVPGWPGANSVKVAGEVNSPGNYEVFAGKMNVLDLVFLAGGFDDKADVKNIIFMPRRDGNREEIILNLDKELLNTQYDSLPIVAAGDVIYVPKKKQFWPTFYKVARDLVSLATLVLLLQRNYN